MRQMLRKMFQSFLFGFSMLAFMLVLFPQQAFAGGPPPAEFYRDPIIGVDSFFHNDDVLSTYEASGVFLPAFSEPDGSPRDNLTAGNPAATPDVGMAQAYDGGDNFLGYGRERSSVSNGYDLFVQSIPGVNNPVNWTSQVLSSSGDCAGGCPYGFSQIQDIVPDFNGGAYVLFEDGAEGGPIPTPFGATTLVYINPAGTVDWIEALSWRSAAIVTDGNDGVWLLRDSGPNFDGSGSTSVGILEHYVPAGQDLTFGGAGTVTVSSDAVSDKGGAAIVPYLDGGGDYDIMVLWADNDAVNPGIYARRFDDTGSAHASFSSTRGNRVVNVVNIDAAYFSASPGLFQIRADANPIILGDLVYAGAILDGELSVFALDGDGVNQFPCGYNAVTSDFDQFDMVMRYGISGGDRGGYLIWQDGNDLNMSLIGPAGESEWDVGGETIFSSASLEVTLKSPGFVSNARGRYEASSALLDTSTTGGTLIYGTGGVGFTRLDFTDGDYPSGAGGDCPAAAVPDAIADLSAVAGDAEVDLNWSAPADNGSPITDYVIEFREFPAGVFATFADGVSVGTSVTVPILTNGLVYEFRVSAVNGAGTSAVSNLVQSTPAGLSGRSVSREKGTAPSVILGKIREFFAITAPDSDSGSLKGSAPDSFSEKVQESDGGEDRSAYIRYEQEQQILRGAAERREGSDQLRDLMLELTRLFLWMKGDQYQPTVLTEQLATPYYDFFLTRYFHNLAGVEYLESRDDSAYEFQYRDPINDPTRILADYQKSVMLTFGRVCFDPDLLRYAEEIDVIGNGAWFHRYAEIMKHWTAAVLGTQNTVPWRTTQDIDVLQSLLRFLVNHCEA